MPLVVWLLIDCGVILMFATLDINATGVVLGTELLRKENSLNLKIKTKFTLPSKASYPLSLHLYTSILVYMFYL